MRSATLIAVLLAASTAAAQVQWRRFAPATDFEPNGPVANGAVAYEPLSGFAYYAGQTATSGSASETWRHVDGSWHLVPTATPLPLFPLTARPAAATWPGHGMLLVAAGQTWLFDGTDWSQLTVPGTPSFVPTMAFDAARSRMVALVAPAVHEFDGSAWQLVPAAGPPFSFNGVLAWHAQLQRIVLYGTNGSARGYSSWSGTAWTNHFAANGSPWGFSLAPAPGGQVLASGGWDGTFAYGNSETWSGSGAPVSVHQLPNAPPWRERSISWFDPVAQQTVVTSFHENWTTWTWDGSAWSVSGTGAQPPSWDNVAYDSWRGELLMAGGWSAPSIEHSDLWTRRGTQWTRIGTGPFAARRYASVAFDSARGRLVMFGGATHDSGAGAWYTLLDTTTSEWNGSTWSSGGTAGPTPAPRQDAAMAFDRQRARTVLFGGRTRTAAWTQVRNDTWEWDGTTWTPQSPATVPPTDGYPTMTFDSSTGTCVMHTQGQLWRWNGLDWVSAGPSPPGARLVEDTARGRLVLVAGAFELQGTTWVQVTTRAGRGGAAFDLARGAVVGIDQGGTYELGDPAAAVIEPLGAGCAGTNGVPVLHGEVPPRLGTMLSLRVERVPANGLAIALLGGDTSTWLGLSLPLDLAPIGMPGCALATPLDLTILLPSPDWTIPLPAFTPALVGASFRAQSLVLDPLANPFGAVLSNTLRLRAGA